MRHHASKKSLRMQKHSVKKLRVKLRKEKPLQALPNKEVATMAPPASHHDVFKYRNHPLNWTKIHTKQLPEILAKPTEKLLDYLMQKTPNLETQDVLRQTQSIVGGLLGEMVRPYTTMAIEYAQQFAAEQVINSLQNIPQLIAL